MQNAKVYSCNKSTFLFVIQRTKPNNDMQKYYVNIEIPGSKIRNTLSLFSACQTLFTCILFSNSIECYSKEAFRIKAFDFYNKTHSMGCI